MRRFYCEQCGCLCFPKECGYICPQHGEQKENAIRNNTLADLVAEYRNKRTKVEAQ